jgi:ubiquitin carboxyl-terminal hydrolase 5/13
MATSGCGRQNWDGTGGKGHALEHHQQCGFPLVVKLGTITGEGKAGQYLKAERESSVSIVAEYKEGEDQVNK